MRFKYVLLTLGWLATVSQFVFTEGKPLHEDQQVAVVYAGRTYHEEVTASITCLLHELGFYVMVYIENGFSWSGMLIPFTEKRVYSSRSLYGHCVHEFVTIKSDMKVVDNPAVLLFITYPMMNYGAGNGKDTYSFELIDRMDRSGTKLILVTHHAENFWRQAEELSKYFHNNDTTFLFLAEHVRSSAEDSLRQHPHLPRYHLDYVFPVFQLSSVLGTEAFHRAATAWRNTPEVVTYSLQGNFGGRHAHRKNLTEITDCLNTFGADLKQSNATHVYAAKTLHRKEKHAQHRRFHLHSHPAADVKGNGNMMLPALRLDLVGHLEPNALNSIHPKHFDLRASSDLSCPQFYTRLARAKFLVTALGSDAYARTQATSTVPAAVITHAPLLTTTAFLQLYPCLRDQPTLRHINGASECESVRNAYALSDSDYELARGEMKGCQEILWADSLSHMRRILSI